MWHCRWPLNSEHCGLIQLHGLRLQEVEQNQKQRIRLSCPLMVHSEERFYLPLMIPQVEALERVALLRSPRGCDVSPCNAINMCKEYALLMVNIQSTVHRMVQPLIEFAIYPIRGLHIAILEQIAAGRLSQ